MAQGDAITLDDFRRYGLVAATAPLPADGWHCGRRAVPVLLSIAGRVEYGMTCCRCDTVWRTGVEAIQHEGGEQREASNRTLVSRARAWDDEWLWYADTGA